MYVWNLVALLGNQPVFETGRRVQEPAAGQVYALRPFCIASAIEEYQVGSLIIEERIHVGRPVSWVDVGRCRKYDVKIIAGDRFGEVLQRVVDGGAGLQMSLSNSGMRISGVRFSRRK
jgi:hypothetical protein